MTIRGVILDLDGTLVDTNPAHVEAWRRAFREGGYDVPADRIWPEVGKGGDQLVPAIIGEAAAAKDGKSLQKAHGEAFEAIAAGERFRVFPGAVDLIRGLKDRGVRTALATSSRPEHLKATFTSCGVDFTDLVDEATNAADIARSKPAPDLIDAALGKLGLSAAECAMVGDTPHDGAACRKAGVRFWAVLCGGFPEADLRAAGAEVMARDPADLLVHIEPLLKQG